MLHLVKAATDYSRDTRVSATATHTDNAAHHLAMLQRIPDTRPEAVLDRITALAASLFNAAISIICFLDGDHLRFKSHYGLGVTEVSWSSADTSASAIERRIRRAFDLGFFIGVPLTTRDGYDLATLCVIDRQPHRVDEHHICHLKALANIAIDLWELRLSTRLADARVEARVEAKAGEADKRATSGPQFAENLQRPNQAVTLASETRLTDLTPRQREIMELVVGGYPSKVIAVNLGISQRTVENHRAAIMKKTGAKSLPALTRLAYVAGMAPVISSTRSTLPEALTVPDIAAPRTNRVVRGSARTCRPLRLSEQALRARRNLLPGDTDTLCRTATLLLLLRALSAAEQPSDDLFQGGEAHLLCSRSVLR